MRFKTEWDATRAIQKLNGKLVKGKKIGVQKVKYFESSVKKSGQIVPATVFRQLHLFSQRRKEDQIFRQCTRERKKLVLSRFGLRKTVAIRL